MAMPLSNALLSNMSNQLDTYQPGAKSAHQNEQIKHQISSAINNFRTVSKLPLNGEDAEIRPVAVGLQTIFELSLIDMVEQGKITKAIAIIHTKKPTTPLCNPEKMANPDTMSAEMQNDPARKKTVTDRTVTLRHMARLGERMSLYVAYPQEGLQARTEQEQAQYNSELTNKENGSLTDLPLSHKGMSEDLIGASYIMTGADNEPLYFGLRAVQAIEAGEKPMAGVCWLGKTTDPDIKPHYQNVKSFLQSGTEIDLQLP